MCNNILNTILGDSQGDTLNRLLVVIKKDSKAFIYKENFPFTLRIRLKKSKKALEVVFQEEIADIIGVKFSDAVFNLNIEDGDKFVWLFRVNWKFGLFFDFSGQLKSDRLFEELGKCYRRLLYLDVYAFLEDQYSFDELLKEGWFPFVQLIGQQFRKLISYYADDKKYSFYIDEILESFNQEKIQAFSDYWWDNQIFSQKREIIEAGVEAYFQDTKSGYINVIKTLSTEIEGIIRLAYFIEHKAKPSTEGLKKYITDCGEKKFTSVGSLGFPRLFYDYLNQSIFKGFDLKSGEIPSSRHSVAHGVAKIEAYDRIRAFQLILTLDQIYFFLGK